MHLRTKATFRRSRTLILLAAAAIAAGCTPQGESSARAQHGASPSGASLPDASELAAGEATAAQWRAKVSEVRTELEAVARQSAADTTATRLRALSSELAALERQIAGAAVVTANKPVMTPPVIDSDVVPASGVLPPAMANHPFAPAVQRAKKSLGRFEAIKDYRAVIVKRERMFDGKLNDYEYLSAKIRHKPFSVYLRFLGPEKFRGREVIYVEGQNGGNLLAHEPKSGLVGLIANSLLKTVSLPPKHNLATMGNRYDITEIGVLNLTKRLIEVGEVDMRHAGAEAKFFPQARVNDRACEAYVFMHPEKREPFRFYRAEVFIDKELGVPIRYASYDWPPAPGEVPPLLEQYTYTRLELNVGLTDADFDVRNPQYEFPQ